VEGEGVRYSEQSEKRYNGTERKPIGKNPYDERGSC